MKMSEDCLKFKNEKIYATKRYGMGYVVEKFMEEFYRKGYKIIVLKDSQNDKFKWNPSLL